ncbi:hypothetical protein [Anianabacter salinae]|uniref:hypothetical protein n=1 Tax=Anianabacter salinae TaxID=2851023 RepID=UPI00225E661A|nr:hypothetical protein [Anianabacter salinae]MBV0912800.1 hypothetical protein [Anianabacter salinae]
MKSLPLFAVTGCLALAGCGGFPDLDDRFTDRGTGYPALEPIDPLLAERSIARIPDGTADGLAARRDALLARSSYIDTTGLSAAERDRLDAARDRQIALVPQSRIDADTLAARGDALRARSETALEARNSVLMRDAGSAIAEAEGAEETLAERTAALRAHRDRIQDGDQRAAVALSDLTALGEDPTAEELERIAELRARAEELRRRAQQRQSQTN